LPPCASNLLVLMEAGLHSEANEGSGLELIRWRWGKSKSNALSLFAARLRR